ncbi:SusC/RagA family TonB-linked outer membrane protein [Draconibacterium mangrovi]|uniref:SusC/RagA family TonB-linked outer membrane protein n=1 Tax=Draconibacterium mangrovi TaxID=2697469 RepID=UPI0013D8D1A6|nr:TonB-dependent receptor [Draconibacterium mangrovi]
MRKSRKRHLFDRKDYVFNFKKLKLTLLLSILLCSTGWVSSAAQAKLNLNLRNATVKELITQIESQTEYYVLYQDEVFQEGQKISIQAENKSINYVLEELCKQAFVTAEIEDNQIILRKAKPAKAVVPAQQDQQKVVSGVVTEVDGFPIPGVSIMVLGTSRGTVTNVNGEYNIRVSVSDTLQFSFVGKKPEQVVIKDQNVVNITLYDDETELEEVQVVAFGKQKKESVISSIETVRPAELKQPSSNLTTALAGKIPGIISYQTSGEPGADNAQFFVRGVTTFGYKTNPLILIDGFEASSDDLARLEPDNIESFSILKDASATVLYGARGANGIIIVETKSGREGPAKINVRLESHLATPTQMNELLDGVEYMKLYNEARISRNPLLGTYYSEQKIQSTADGVDPMIYPNIDWYDELFEKSTINKKANFNVSGGGKVATYYVAGSIENETGLLKVDSKNNFNNNIDINRVQLRNNVIIKITPTTRLDTRLQGRFERYNGPNSSAGDIFRMVMNSNPVDFPAVYEPDEAHLLSDHILFGNTFVNGGLKQNPYAEMVRGYEDRNESSITAMATLSQELDFITEGLKLQAKASVNTWSYYSSRRTYSPFFYDLESYNQITGEYKLFELNPEGGQVYLGDVDPGRDASAHYYYEARLNWDREFGNHSIGVMTVGMFEEYLLTAGNSTSIYETLPERNMGNSGRLTYDYDTRYFFEFAYGYNGSEKFSGSKRYGFFPSFGGGWLISNENFWTPMKDIVNSLKLKATWGKVGNDAIAGRQDRFFYLSDISKGGNGYRWGTTFMNEYGGYNINRYANPDITWEVSTKMNLGLEMTFLDDALKIQGDLFKDVRDQIYLQRQNFPASAGLEAAISGNVGKVESWGYEASADYQYISPKDWWLTGRANITFATNKYVELDEKEYADEYLKQKGHSTNQWWGLIAERLFVDEAEIANSPKQDFGTYQAGDIKYKDVNGDGIVNSNDRVPLGLPTVPEIQYGFGASGGFKNFDLSFFFQGNARVSFFIDASDASDNVNNRHGIAPFASRRNALSLIAEDHWSETNPDVHAFWPRLSVDPLANNTQTSTWWLRNGAFLRLKTVEMGYNIKTKGFEKIGLENARIYCSGVNLFVVSPFKLWDPEMGRAGLGYPPNRRFNIGVQLAF